MTSADRSEVIRCRRGVAGQRAEVDALRDSHLRPRCRSRAAGRPSRLPRPAAGRRSTVTQISAAVAGVDGAGEHPTTLGHGDLRQHSICQAPCSRQVAPPGVGCAATGARDPVACRGIAARLRYDHRDRDLRPACPVVVLCRRRPAIETPDVVRTRGDGAAGQVSERMLGPGPAGPFESVDPAGPASCPCSPRRSWRAHRYRGDGGACHLIGEAAPDIAWRGDRLPLLAVPVTHEQVATADQADRPGVCSAAGGHSPTCHSPAGRTPRTATQAWPRPARQTRQGRRRRQPVSTVATDVPSTRFDSLTPLSRSRASVSYWASKITADFFAETAVPGPCAGLNDHAARERRLSLHVVRHALLSAVRRDRWFCRSRARRRDTCR